MATGINRGEMVKSVIISTLLLFSLTSCSLFWKENPVDIETTFPVTDDSSLSQESGIVSESLLPALSPFPEEPLITPAITPAPTLPPPGMLGNMMAVYCQESFSYTPTENMDMGEIVFSLTQQVMEYVKNYVSEHPEECTYQLTDYRIISTDDIQEIKSEDEVQRWIAWPGVEIAWTGWYGIEGVMPADIELCHVGDTDGGIAPVIITEKEGVYTLICGAP